MVVKGGWWWEKVRRGVRTVYFVVAMVASLVVVALPVVVAISDAVLPCLLISSFTCVRCYNFREHLRRYSFKCSLIDIPLFSIIRSIIITCVYTLCDGPALSHGPYLGTVALCSLVSILLLSIKTCVYSVNSEFESETSTSLSRKRLHLKKSWGMPVLFLSSVVFALGHIVVAYRTSCKARRKNMFHRVDPEAAPLYVEGWDEALHEIGKLSYEIVLSAQNAAALLNAVESLPILVVSGAEDVLVPLKSVQTMASKLVNSRLVAISGCGHLPHEECPKALLAAISPFISKLILKSDLQNQ